jgi:hypothetical protein
MFKLGLIMRNKAKNNASIYAILVYCTVAAQTPYVSVVGLIAIVHIQKTKDTC